MLFGAVHTWMDGRPGGGFGFSVAGRACENILEVLTIACYRPARREDSLIRGLGQRRYSGLRGGIGPVHLLQSTAPMGRTTLNTFFQLQKNGATASKEIL